MEVTVKLPENVTFRDPSPDNFGYFILTKSMFVIDGVNTTYSGRCDTMTYTIECVAHNTAYHDEGIYLGETSPYTGHQYNTSDGAWVRLIDATPDFCIIYTYCTQTHLDVSRYPADFILRGDFPASLWYGKSVIELFKNMREWSFMLEEPFNSDHPMAIYSKMALDTLNPPQEIIDEIDSMPDMHLARFLKGDPNHREILDNYPQMSENMMNWFKEKMDLFPHISTNQRLMDLEL
jgi:hypothetical protein